MDVNKILKNAIASEIAAHDLYMKASGLAKKKAAKDLFLQLAAEEQEHKKKLEGLTKKKFDIEESKLKKAGFAENLLMTPLNEMAELKEVMEYAISREQTEHDSYARLAALFVGRSEAQLFKTLATEENTHKEKLKKEYGLMFT